MLDPLNKWPYSNNVPNQSHIDFTGIQSCKENVRFPHCANTSLNFVLKTNQSPLAVFAARPG